MRIKGTFFTYCSIKKHGPFSALIKGLLFFLTAYLSYIPAFPQTLKPGEKIDPVFQQIIEQRTNRLNSVKNYPSHFRVQPTEGFVSKNGSLEKRYECIVYTNNTRSLRENGIVINSELPTIVTAWVTLDQIQQMSNMQDVKYIEAPATDYLYNDISVSSTGAFLLHEGKLNNTVYKGKNVIIGVYDTGIDWDHPDFRDPNDPTKSRILRIWDQTITAGPGEAPPAGFNYGVEYTQAQINDELDGSPANLVREKDIFGHGTHVTGTAAGNGTALPSKKYMGMAPEADLVIIKGSDSLFSETREIDGITYLGNVASALGRPVVLNMSLGGQSGAHDGSRAAEIAVNNFTASAPGRAVVISAGNDNGTNIHNRISLAAFANTAITFNVPAGSTGTDVFKYRVYANDNSAVSANLIAPGDGGNVMANAGQISFGNVLTEAFNVTVNNFIQVSNNNRYVDVSITRNGINTISPGGTWILSITNNTSNALTFDGWLYERTKPYNTTVLVGGNSDYLVGAPGTAASAITAASYVTNLKWFTSYDQNPYVYNSGQQDSISTFSSRGPRRDNIQKPDLAAPGQAIISCLSTDQSPAPTTTVIVPGLYHVEQGTSMAAPCITGAVALLFQAKPTATAAEIKSLLTSTATKDAWTELPGVTSNSTWGAGRLDVFKAASKIFNCLPTDRKTYQYDNSPERSAESYYNLTTQRIAVRVTPDITGKLESIYFHTSIVLANMVVEVRTNNGGVPGTLLGLINIDSINLKKYSFNYVDLNSQNISVNIGTDYFVVLARNTVNTNPWSIYFGINTSGTRSLFSNNAGVSWFGITNDLRIRAVVYNNAQVSGAIATSNSSDTRDITVGNQFINSNCGLIAQLSPSGISAVTGNVSCKIWLEPGVPIVTGKPYASRHYEITPQTGASDATGKVTLYFTQADFNTFNAHPGSTLNLPANPSDILGKSNLRIGQNLGTSSDGTGLFESYSETHKVIDPADGDIVWNAQSGRWEVSFETVGFGGFVLQTDAFVLPLIVEYFKGSRLGSANMISGKINCASSTSGSTIIEVERSDNGSYFSSIGFISASQALCSQPFDFKDVAPMAGNNFYRIKINENGVVHYTSTILLQTDKLFLSTLFPTIIKKGGSVQVNYAGAQGTLVINDALGRQVYSRKVTNGIQIMSLPIYTSSLYFYTIKERNNIIVQGKIIVE